MYKNTNVKSGTIACSSANCNPTKVTKKPAPNCRMPNANFIGMLGFLPI